eukprot:gene1535-1873_t
MAVRASSPTDSNRRQLPLRPSSATGSAVEPGQLKEFIKPAAISAWPQVLTECEGEGLDLYGQKPARSPLKLWRRLILPGLLLLFM